MLMFSPSVTLDETSITIPRDVNQVEELIKYSKLFIFEDVNDKNDRSTPPSFGNIPPSCLSLVSLFNTDSILCGYSALALMTNAPTVLFQEAVEEYKNANGSCLFGTTIRVATEKAVAANCAASREWDSNGTLFGYREGAKVGHQAGEFGHNDFYPVVLGAAQKLGREKSFDGRTALRAMICLDEIRGRLAEVFSLKTYKIDHVLHGAIAAAIVYGTLLGASISQIESAVGMVVAHYTPWRAIRAGHQLSDSKGSSAALSTEVAVMSIHRAMRGFQGPRDIFRNPEALFLFFEPSASPNSSPFDLILTHSGDDFAVCGMHFKLGLYEHQSAGAIHGLIKLMVKYPNIYKCPQDIKSIEISSYKTAVGIIGDPAKMNPTTRQSADHSMVYIISTLIYKANRLMVEELGEMGEEEEREEEFWSRLMPLPDDYSRESIMRKDTHSLMKLITFRHGGPSFDSKYPEGIPTQIKIIMKNYLNVTNNNNGDVAPDMKDMTMDELDSGFILFPVGHCRCARSPSTLLKTKFRRLGELALKEGNGEGRVLEKGVLGRAEIEVDGKGSNQKKRVEALIDRLGRIGEMTGEELQSYYHVDGGFMYNRLVD